MKISVVIPVYNIEVYVTQCIKSVVDQAVEGLELEVVVVNDGSSDNSLEVIKDLAQRYNSIVIVEKQNGGLSDARNAGIKRAVGDYILFLDGDDFLIDGALGVIYENLIKYPDMAMIGYYKYDERGYYHPGRHLNLGFIDSEIDLERSFMRIAKFSMAWQFVVKRQVIESNQLFFIKGLSPEDEWAVRMLASVNSIIFIPEFLYCYRIKREDSITTGFSRNRYDYFINCLKLIQLILNDSEKYTGWRKKKIPERAANLYLYLLLQGLNNLTKSQCEGIIKELSKQIEILNIKEVTKYRLVYILCRLIGPKMISRILFPPFILKRNLDIPVQKLYTFLNNKKINSSFKRGKSSILLVGNFISSNIGTRCIGEELSLRLSANGWRTIETSHQTKRVFRFVDMLFSVLFHKKKYQAAYVEIYSGGLSFLWAEAVVFLLSFLCKPVVLALHGGGLVEFAKRQPLRFTNLLRRGKIIVTPSLFLQTNLKQYNSTIRYLPNAAEISQYKFQIRSHLTPNIIWLRAFQKICNPELAVKVIACLVKNFDKIKLTMIGPDWRDGSLSSTLKLAKSLGVASHINIVGPVSKSEVPAWLEKGDIFLNTTRFESFGISVLEAALIGLPIVTTNVGELPYLWEHEKTAMLVPQNDVKSMANAIQRILTESKLAERLSQNARLKAEKFDWSVVFPQWENLFLEVVKS